MNPITSLLEHLEKLITEHGSAAVLREHLSLLKSQTSILEKENTELKTKNQILESENQNLKQENINLKNNIEGLSHNIPPCSVSSVESPDDVPSWKKIREQLKKQI